MQIDILSIFPEMFNNVLQESILKRAQNKGLVKVAVHNLRKWTNDKHKTTDDRPFGGGPGMVMKVEPIFLAVKELKNKNKETKVVLLTPEGRAFKQSVAFEFSRLEHLILICGRYEGIDERVRHFVDEEISVGDYVLTGGELPAMIVVDAVVRLLQGVLGNQESLESESFSGNKLDYPQYTQPKKFMDYEVPEILLSGNHKEIAKWRETQSVIRTKEKRPDLQTSI